MSDTGGVSDSVADDHILLSVYVDDGQLHEQPVSVKVHTDRQTHRHTDTACQRQGTHRQIGRQTDPKTDMHARTHTHHLSVSRHTQTHTHTDTQAGR